MHKQPGILFDRRYLDHAISRPSAECADRVRSLYAALEEPSYARRFRQFTPRTATTDEVMAVHSSFYLEQISRHADGSDPYAYDCDTYLMDRTVYTAELAAGGCLELADRIMAGEIDSGFALIRPPGHHAEAGRGMGFCVLNNVAITAAYLQRIYGLSRILIVDFDVHHGNGTQSIFYETDQVLFLSLHQARLFPFSGDRTEIGSGAGEGYTINLPVPQQFGDVEYTYLFGRVLGAVVEQYLPQMILVSAGYDAHGEDTISRTQLTSGWYRMATTLLKYLAAESCDSRLLMVLEGGYNPASLRQSVLATLDGLLEPVSGRPGILHSERAFRILADHPLNRFWVL